MTKIALRGKNGVGKFATSFRDMCDAEAYVKTKTKR